MNDTTTFEKKETNKELLDKIYEEGENIYPISEESDKKCEEMASVDNWAEMFYNIKRPKIKERFIKIISNSENKNFFIGLDYEYGINGKTIDIKKAFDIYREAANKSTDTLSMYKMYKIYKKEFQKFGIPKRNRIYEKFYLLKCFAYSEGQELDHSRNLYNRFDVIREVAIQLSEEDIELEKFDLLINHLKKYYKELNINLDDIIIIEAVFALKFRIEIEKEEDVTECFNDKKLIKNNLEAIYKTAFFLSSVNLKCAEKYFKILYEKKYYRSYPDYTIFLYKVLKDTNKSLEIAKIAYENGVISAANLYYDIYLNSCDFIKFVTDNSEDSKLKEIFDILISLISVEEIFRYFEYFYLRKVCIKHYNQKDYLDKLFFYYTKEIAEFIIEITKGENGNKEQIMKFLLKDDFYCEFNLVCGEIYCYGIEGLVEKDYEKAIEKFKIPYKNSESETYKRFAYAYIVALRKKLLDSGSKTVTLEKVNKNRKKLFDLYITSIKKIEEFPHLSSSYCFFMSKMYRYKYNEDKKNDLIMEYVFLKKSTDRPLDNPGYGSIVAVYRKYKSIIKVQKEENTRFKGVLDDIKENEDNEGYGDDNSICPICFDEKRVVICLPCKHLFCETCIKIIIDGNKCPICRRLIIYSFKIKK